MNRIPAHSNDPAKIRKNLIAHRSFRGAAHIPIRIHGMPHASQTYKRRKSPRP